MPTVQIFMQEIRAFSFTSTTPMIISSTTEYPKNVNVGFKPRRSVPRQYTCAPRGHASALQRSVGATFTVARFRQDLS